MLAYYDERAPEYEEAYTIGTGTASIPDIEVFKAEARAMEDIVVRVGHGRVLDLPCGTAYWLPHYAANCSRITAMDGPASGQSRTKRGRTSPARTERFRNAGMRTRTIALAAIVAAALAWPRPAPAATLTDNDVRGGWIADVGGQRVIYVLKVRDGRISGIYCSDCTNPDEVAFLQDGKVEAGGIAFRVLHVAGPGAPYSEMVRGRLENGRLVLTSTRERAPRASATVTSLTREPRRTRNGLPWPVDQFADGIGTGLGSIRHRQNGSPGRGCVLRVLPAADPRQMNLSGSREGSFSETMEPMPKPSCYSPEGE
jgi:hypothetical protein